MKAPTSASQHGSALPHGQAAHVYADARIRLCSALAHLGLGRAYHRGDRT
jgi:hypothetical protein